MGECKALDLDLSGTCVAKPRQLHSRDRHACFSSALILLPTPLRPFVIFALTLSGLDLTSLPLRRAQRITAWAAAGPSEATPHSTSEQPSG